MHFPRSLLNYPHPLLAREGWPFIALTLGLAFLGHWFGSWGWGLPLDVLAVFVLQFFRDPPRLLPPDADAVLSPADGRVIKVQRIFDPYAEREASLHGEFFAMHRSANPSPRASATVSFALARASMSTCPLTPRSKSPLATRSRRPSPSWPSCDPKTPCHARECIF